MDNKEYIPKEARGHKRMKCAGYYIYYLPDHHLANNSGTVYEHMLAAEEMLGRNLRDGEVIHHRDKNRMNNNLDNLMVFKTSSDHVAFHNGMNVEMVGDVYVTNKASTIDENGRRISLDRCPVCGGEKCYGASLCVDCYNKERAKNIPPRDELYWLLPDYSMCEIGRKYGVSDNAVRKWCRKYGLPFKREDINKEFGIIKKKEKLKPTPPRPVDMYTLDGDFIQSFASLGEAAKHLMDEDVAKGGKAGIAGHISNVCKGRANMAYGFKWKFK